MVFDFSSEKAFIDFDSANKLASVLNIGYILHKDFTDVLVAIYGCFPIRITTDIRGSFHG